MGQNKIKQTQGKPDLKVNKTLKPVKKGEPFNVEGERGEVIVSPMNHMGFPELYTIGGERHYNGGADLNVPDNSFFFSRDKTLRIKDPDVLESFDKKAKKVGYSPAEIAKQYDINKYLKVLVDPDADKMQKSTAESMIKNYNQKLGKLALTQEAQKGFPSGVPFIANPFMQEMGIPQDALIHGAASDEPEVPTEPETQKMGGSMKVKIVGVPQYQKGGPKKDDKEFAFNQNFYNDYANKIGPDNVTAGLSPFMAESRGMVGHQSKNGNSYGRADWTDSEHLQDFRNRNAWYFKEHPDFDPRNKSQVKNFQLGYNERVKSQGLSPYFKIPKPGEKESIYDANGKLGEVTFSTPNLDYKPAEAPQGQIQVPPYQREINARRVPVNHLQDKPVAEKNTPFWSQDMVNLLGANSDYNRLRKYMPWQAGYQTVLPKAIFADPTRELAANSEQSAIAGDVLGSFAGPQSLNSRMSEVQGRALENAANIMGKYNNLNVGVANYNEMNKTGIMNYDSLNRANRTTDLYNKGVISQQQFDNSRAMARQNIRNAFVTALTNRGRTQALNSVNKQFRVNPKNGFVEFTGTPGNFNPVTAQADIMDKFNEYMGNPNLQKSPEGVGIAYRMAAKAAGMPDDQDQLGQLFQSYLQQLPQAQQNQQYTN